MSEYEYVILGGGVAGGYAARELAEHDDDRGSACLVAAEKRPPYHRPPLSKDVLRGETESLKDILIEPVGFYDENGIDLKLGAAVFDVDLETRSLHAEGEQVDFGELLIATGARPRKLSVPGADLKGIYYLRSSRDAADILGATEDAEKAFVYGGGFIGSEVAASLTESGVSVTLAFPERRLLQDRPFTPEMSDFFEDRFRQAGVEIMPGEGISAFNGAVDVSSVSLDSGATLEADLVVLGVGVLPNTRTFVDTALEIEDGIVVDWGLETNVRGVFAAGDVARYPDRIFNTDRRIEHWDNARRQGRHAVRSMLGDKKPYRYVPYFFSDVFDLSWEFWGDRREADQLVYRGSIENGSFSTWWLENREIVAAFVMDRPAEEREHAPDLIEKRQRVDPLRLSDESRPLKT